MLRTTHAIFIIPWTWILVGCGGVVPLSNEGTGGTAGYLETGGAGAVPTGGDGSYPVAGGASALPSSGADPDRSLVALASNQNSPIMITIDESAVYWTNFGTFGDNDGSVMKVALGGGSPEVLVPGANAAGGIAVDATYVYYSAGYPDRPALLKVPLAGGNAPVLLAYGFVNDPFAIDSGYAYGLGSRSIVSVPLTGGSTSTVAEMSAASYGVAVDATSVYWTGFSTPCTINKAPISGGVTTILATVEDGPCVGIAIDSEFVYFGAAGSVGKVGLNGGPVITLAPDRGQGLAIDDNYVYFSDWNSTIKKVAKTGGPVITLATEQNRPWGIAVDAASVYWANEGVDRESNGSIMKLTPK